MVLRVGINGFGRIGRLVLRAIIESKRNDIEVVGVNDLGSPEANAHLLKYDSVHGTLPADVSIENSTMIVERRAIRVIAEKDPTKLPWKELGVEVALECTGRFTDREKAEAHLTAGAKKVLISAPAKGVDLTVVYGVNEDKLTKSQTVISNASCTTNCLAPVAHILHKAFGIEKGYMTTVHSFTGDQRTVDTLHEDPRRARAASVSMIPTTTGAAKAVGLVLPELAGKLDGTSIRVPTPNVSLIDFNFLAGRDTTAEEINKAMIEASKSKRLKGVLAVTDKPLVSVDFNHDPHSATFDLTQTQVIGGNFCRVLAWYDNEWGFSNRMGDTAVAFAGAK
ncbi:MAG: type I glyceraldehyde-3-phosphate dehydrogenase [Rhodospirillales bacterium]|nr:type I glyceraldehyde-3-phosphate dehydrogenase [Rhodospirillales bacterium]